MGWRPRTCSPTDDELLVAVDELELYDPADRRECDRVTALLRDTTDPTAPADSNKAPVKLAVTRVERVYRPDEDGLGEVLYRDGAGRPVTAYMRADVVVSLCDGW